MWIIVNLTNKIQLKVSDRKEGNKEGRKPKVSKHKMATNFLWLMKNAPLHTQDFQVGQQVPGSVTIKALPSEPSQQNAERHSTQSGKRKMTPQDAITIKSRADFAN